jgi:hypothetical protein
MDMDENGFEGVEEGGARLACAIDPRLAEVWTTLFSAELSPEDLEEQVGWFLRMAYLRGYHDGLCEPEIGSLYRELGVVVPPRRRSISPRPRSTHRREA